MPDLQSNILLISINRSIVGKVHVIILPVRIGKASCRELIRVQRKATKMIRLVGFVTCEKKLKEQGLLSSEENTEGKHDNSLQTCKRLQESGRFELFSMFIVSRTRSKKFKLPLT